MAAPDPRALRAEVLMSDLRLYEVAARVGVNPGRLGQILRGRAPLSLELASRISEVLRAEDERAGQ